MYIVTTIVSDWYCFLIVSDVFSIPDGRTLCLSRYINTIYEGSLMGVRCAWVGTYIWGKPNGRALCLNRYIDTMYEGSLTGVPCAWAGTYICGTHDGHTFYMSRYIDMRIAWRAYLEHEQVHIYMREAWWAYLVLGQVHRYEGSPMGRYIYTMYEESLMGVPCTTDVMLIKYRRCTTICQDLWLIKYCDPPRVTQQHAYHKLHVVLNIQCTHHSHHLVFSQGAGA